VPFRGGDRGSSTPGGKAPAALGVVMCRVTRSCTFSLMLVKKSARPVGIGRPLEVWGRAAGPYDIHPVMATAGEKAFDHGLLEGEPEFLAADDVNQEDGGPCGRRDLLGRG